MTFGVGSRVTVDGRHHDAGVAAAAVAAGKSSRRTSLPRAMPVVPDSQGLGGFVPPHEMVQHGVFSYGVQVRVVRVD
jgi:hypothetical protein